eukprot:UN13162
MFKGCGGLRRRSGRLSLSCRRPRSRLFERRRSGGPLLYLSLARTSPRSLCLSSSLLSLSRLSLSRSSLCTLPP